MLIRLSGRFTHILGQWLADSPFADPALAERLLRMEKASSVTVEEWRAALARAACLSPEPHFGLAVGQKVTLANVGVLGYLVLNSENLFDALQTYQLSERRFYGVNFCELTQIGDELELSWPDHIGGENGLFVQVALAALVSFLRQRFPVSLRMTGVLLSENRPAACSPYEEFFGCPVQFSERQPGIRVDAQWARRPEDGKLSLAYDQARAQQTNAFTSVVPDNSPFLRDLQPTLLQLIPKGEVSLSQVAKSMAVSPRTLQRRLSLHHLNYQLLLDGLREQLACRYLLDSSLSLVEIALLLGYSEQSAFCRAFKLWTGQTPGAYQKAAQPTR